MDRQTPAVRRGPVLTAALVMVVGFVWAFADPAAGTTFQTGVPVFDDDTGLALFDPALQLAPGHSYVSCISVSALGSDPQDAVKLTASGVAGGLVPYLTLTVEMGTGGHFGDCTGFAGATVFTGLLSDLAAADSGAGVDTGWRPQGDPDRTFRFTAGIDPALTTQGLSAQGTFVWRLVQVDPPPPDPPNPPLPPSPSPSPTPTETPSPSDEPSAEPSSEPTGTTDPGSGGVPGDGGTDSPTPTPDPSRSPDAPATTSPLPSPAASSAPTPTGSTAAGGSGAGPTASPGADRPRADVTIGGTLAQIQAVLDRASAAAAEVVSAPQYPLSALALALGFLMIQDLIDRRDPKLAVVTRSQRDNEAEFPDPFGPSRRGRSRRRAFWTWFGGDLPGDRRRGGGGFA